MPYAKPDDLRKIWNGVLTTNLDTTEAASMIDQAGCYVDAALATRYTVPFATDPDATPPLIRWITATLALMEIVDRSPGTPDWVLRKIQRAEKQLEQLADGTITLPGLAPREDIGSVQSTTEQYVPVFGAIPSLTERWDPQRELDEANLRQP